MIIPIDEDDQNVGADCLLCFDAGKTPNVKTISFGGMSRGALWNPGDPPPPNESFAVGQSGACDWARVVGIWTFNHQIHVGLSFLTIIIPPFETIFSSIIGQCDRHYQNTIVAPAGKHYYGGYGLITWRYPDPPETIGLLAEQWGIPTDGSNTYLPYPMANQQEVIKMQDPAKINKISFKRDFS